jgi:quercetin dioxygenase-like cupin family protein
VFLDDTRFEPQKVVIGAVFSTTIDGHAVLPKRSARIEMAPAAAARAIFDAACLGVRWRCRPSPCRARSRYPPVDGLAATTLTFWRTPMPSLFDVPVHLGPGGRAVPQPVFAGPDWYVAYEARLGGEKLDGRLVSAFRFGPWTSWEMHPTGDELVVCTEGAFTLLQEGPEGRIERVELRAGEWAINPPGVWHTVDVDGTAAALFVTVGWGTQHRPR